MTKAEFIEIIKRCQSGDKKAIGLLYEEYFGKLCSAAFAKVKNTDAAYDIASNVILKLMNFRNDVSKINNPVGYMITMVHNEAINYLRKMQHEVPVSNMYDRSIGMPDTLWLEDICAELTEDESQLFVLHIVWDMPLNKAAKQLGITYKKAKTRYKIIKLKIRAIYEK